jgi:hypothetical protein
VPGQDDDGRGAPAAEPSDDLDAVGVRQPEVQDNQIGLCEAAAVRASPPPAATTTW